jgi:hypothetical protein
LVGVIRALVSGEGVDLRKSLGASCLVFTDGKTLLSWRSP